MKDVALLVIGLAMGGGLAPALEAQQEGPYEVLLYEQDLMLPMRDGVHMATDIYRPARDGRVLEERLPIVMQGTP